MQTVKKIALLAAVIFFAIVFASIGFAIVTVIILLLLLRRVWLGGASFFRDIFGGERKEERAENGAKVIDAEFEIIESHHVTKKDES